MECVFAIVLQDTIDATSIVFDFLYAGKMHRARNDNFSKKQKAIARG